MPKLLLLTGFEPFGRRRVNSSWEMIRDLDGTRLRGWAVAARRLPVSFRRAGPNLRRWLRELRPSAVIAFGLAEEGNVRLERVALNVDHADKPDNDGRRARDRSILRGGALARESRLPLDRIEAALRRAKIPVRRSFHAGTYLCNHVFYVLLSRFRGPAGFIHVPPLATARRRKGRLTLGQLRRVARRVLAAVVR